jgi:UDP-GlcNAc:undecaprenyl-phosphate GlcNAc-1-phosphate transferase
MGDGGSLLLGSLMAASTMAVGGRTPHPFSGQTFFFYAPLAIPVVILGVPMLDTFFAILRRARNGKGLATADKDHLHHRLVRLGHGHRRSVWILWAWTALLSAFVLYPTYNGGQGDAIVPMGVGAAALALFTLFKPGFRLRPEHRTTRRATDGGTALIPDKAIPAESVQIPTAAVVVQPASPRRVTSRPPRNPGQPRPVPTLTRRQPAGVASGSLRSTRNEPS